MRYYSSIAVETSLSAGITSSATSITVASTSGFPAVPPYTLSIDGDNASKELVEVTAAAGTTLTVTRGIDGTSAVSHLLGAQVSHDHSARDFRESREHEAATSGVHGVSGNVVGTSGSQTLSNKTLASPAFTGTPSGLSKSHVGLGNADNTSDANKPVSTAQASAISTAASNAQAAAIAAAGVAATAGTSAAVAALLAALGLTGKKVQIGQVSINGTGLAAGTGTFAAVTFPVAYSGTPFVYVSMASAPAGTGNIVARTAGTTSTTGFNAYAYNAGDTAATWTNLVINWIAVGDA